MQDQTTNPINSQQLASDLVRELIREKRSEKRWKNFRFICWLIFFIVVVSLIYSSSGSNLSSTMTDKDYVSLVRLDGEIGSDKDFSAEQVVPVLKDAFEDKQAKGVIITINSGGGSPVQSSIIHDTIIDFKNKYHKKVVIVGEDLLASGAYYVAVGADKIYVNPNTLTGSIGVIMKSFGFSELIKKVGIERRVFTAGNNKDRLDPFMPETSDDIAKIRTVLAEVHGNFMRIVLEGRKGKLRGDPAVIFSGDFWSGQGALNLGLVDGLGNLSDAMKKEFNVQHYRDYSQSQNLLRMLVGQVGVSFNAALNNDQPALVAKLKA